MINYSGLAFFELRVSVISPLDQVFISMKQNVTAEYWTWNYHLSNRKCFCSLRGLSCLCRAVQTRKKFSIAQTDVPVILYNYPLKGDIHRDAKCWGIYPRLFTDPEVDSCFRIYQIRWTKNRFFNFFFWNFRETTCHFFLCSQNSEYPRIFQVTGANQNVQKLLSTDLVNTKMRYLSTGRTYT